MSYTIVFDNTKSNYQENPELNRLFLTAQQSYANSKLRAHGHVMLNDVYDMLGVPRTTEGFMVGWLDHWDAHISFDIDDDTDDDQRLTFNVDGIVFHKIEDVDDEPDHVETELKRIRQHFWEKARAAHDCYQPPKCRRCDYAECDEVPDWFDPTEE